MEEVRPSSNVFLLLATSLAFTSFVFPPFPNLTSQIFPPHAVKKSRDCLILALVLFAIACGFLRSSGSYRRSDTQKSSLSDPITLDECYYSYDLGREYRFSLGSFGRTTGSGRCPDLRAQDEGRWRLYDHTNLEADRGFGSKHVYSRRILKGDCDDEEKKFQREHVVANDSCDHNAAVEEMEVAVTLLPSALPAARAAPKEPKGQEDISDYSVQSLRMTFTNRQQRCRCLSRCGHLCSTLNLHPKRARQGKISQLRRQFSRCQQPCTGRNLILR